MGANAFESIEHDIETFYSIKQSIHRFFSLHGVYDIFSVEGLWVAIPVLLLLLDRSSFYSTVRKMDLYMYAYLVSVFFQAIISSDLARMFYMILPVFAVFIGISADFITVKWSKELKEINS
jgi:hypothetical protein